MARLDEEPRPRGPCVGEGPLHVPEEFTLEKALGHRGAVDGDEWTVAPRAPRVDGLRHQLFSRPALARDEDRRVGLGDARDKVVHLPHGGAGPEDVIEPLLIDDHSPQALHLFAQGPVRQRALDRERHVVRLERLGDEIVGSRPDRRDRRLHASVGRHDDDRDVLTALDDLPADVHAAHAVHVDVGEDQIEIVFDQPPQGVLPATSSWSSRSRAS